MKYHYKMTLCKFRFDDYYGEMVAVNDNGNLVPVFIGFDLAGWKITCPA